MRRRLFAKRASPPIDELLYGHLALDDQATSTDPTVPAFMAPPPGSPPYYGFQVLHDVAVEGFVLGAINDFEHTVLSVGDAFVVAPDGARAGLEWRAPKEPYVLELAPARADRWGVFAVGFPHVMSDRDAARANLEVLLPLLRERWERWTTR